ncbi:methyltransferase [Piscinibacter sakaiensis]|uniref:Hydroxyneurosporene methyltransferase n=1 Tax=Piscinibacter sakaiensis TaxID=1547922 RepID=A0A0K8NVK2_PISS1|nr:methyltransferase [Piscinibacter sakaiensis]GAP34408.1 hydroxyneurosporene methyltransferase [Piscinibacter sakaiensis]
MQAAGAPPEARGWLERLRDWPQRRVADPAFRRWAESSRWTRWIARRRARELFDLVAGFVYSQVLLACVQLRLFERLQDGPLDADALAPRLGLAPDAVRRLCDAAVALRLLARRSGERYALGPLGAAMVGNDAVAAMVEHHAALYEDLREPLALLRGHRDATALRRVWPYAAAGLAGGAAPRSLAVDAVAGYCALMSASQPLVAGTVLDAWPLRRRRVLLDLGGGEGRFVEAALRRHGALRGLLFDLPAVAARAEARLGLAGLGGRVACLGGDFLRDRLPRGADTISLVRVVHDHDDAAVRTLLRAAHDALPPGGQLLLAEPMARTRGAEAMGDAYFGWYLLAMGQGRPRSADELAAMLREAGFGSVRAVRTAVPLQTGLLVAERSVALD